MSCLKIWPKVSHILLLIKDPIAKSFFDKIKSEECRILSISLGGIKRETYASFYLLYSVQNSISDLNR